ncbi:MAG: putative glutamine amidotransferase, class [Nocardioides sp.]|jgi:hypothetical protein|nr:putative glutamine amidotransferase, class [Nocardioides sp.]
MLTTLTTRPRQRSESQTRKSPDSPGGFTVLLLAKGAAVTTEDVPNAWAAWMSGNDPDHHAIAPFAELSSDVAADDVPYVDAIRAVAQALT